MVGDLACWDSTKWLFADGDSGIVPGGANGLEGEEVAEMTFNSDFESGVDFAKSGEVEGLGLEGFEGEGGAEGRGGVDGGKLVDLAIDEFGFDVGGTEEFPLSGGDVVDAELFGGAGGGISGV